MTDCDIILMQGACRRGWIATALAEAAVHVSLSYLVHLGLPAPPAHRLCKHAVVPLLHVVVGGLREGGHVALNEICCTGTNSSARMHGWGPYNVLSQ